VECLNLWFAIAQTHRLDVGSQRGVIEYASSKVEQRAWIVSVDVEVDSRIQMWCCKVMQLFARKAHSGKVTERHLVENRICKLGGTSEKRRHGVVRVTRELAEQRYSYTVE
jgi:hypothetical protein